MRHLRQRLEAQVRERQEAVAGQILHGKSDFAEYREAVGEYRAYDYVLGWIKQIVVEINGEVEIDEGDTE